MHSEHSLSAYWEKGERFGLSMIMAKAKSYESTVTLAYIPASTMEQVIHTGSTRTLHLRISGNRRMAQHGTAHW